MKTKNPKQEKKKSRPAKSYLETKAKSVGAHASSKSGKKESECCGGGCHESNQ